MHKEAFSKNFSVVVNEDTRLWIKIAICSDYLRKSNGKLRKFNNISSHFVLLPFYKCSMITPGFFKGFVLQTAKSIPPLSFIHYNKAELNNGMWINNIYQTGFADSRHRICIYTLFRIKMCAGLLKT